MQKRGLIRSIRLDGQTVHRAQSSHAWYDVHRDYYEVQPSEETLSYRDWESTARHFGDVVAGEFTCGPFVGHHGPNEMRRSVDDHLVLRLVRKGSFLFQDDIGEKERGTEEIQNLNPSVNFTTISKTESVYLNVLLPFSAVSHDRSQHPRRMHLATFIPIGYLLKSAIVSMTSSLPAIQIGDSPKLARAFGALVRALVTNDLVDEPARRQVKSARSDSIRAYIEGHLHNPDLSVERICQAIGMSRSSAYRHFSEEGGIEKYLMGRRLDRAFRELETSKPVRGKVSATAERVGFRDQHHFSRLFRQRFGMTPTDALNLSPQAEVARAHECKANTASAVS